MQPVLPLDRASVFIDGTVGEPRLSHPEGVAVDRDGNVWCGGDRGEIYRIAPDGSSHQIVASTGGFTLGMAFDDKGRLYTCDSGHAAVFRLDSATGALDRFASSGDGSFVSPNFPVVDVARNCLYVSDPRGSADGRGIWRIDLDSGDVELWYGGPLTFANGLALSPERDTLYVVETFASRVSRIAINADGSAGNAEVFVDGIELLPDGLAFDVECNLYISCYEPSRLFRALPDGTLELLIDDPEAHTFCHPTNCAFRGPDLFTANLGRWHITRINVGIEGVALP